MVIKYREYTHISVEVSTVKSREFTVDDSGFIERWVITGRLEAPETPDNEAE